MKKYCDLYLQTASDILLAEDDMVEPNETKITPLFPELCINASNSAGSGLGGLARSGPTTLVSEKNDNNPVTD